MTYVFATGSGKVHLVDAGVFGFHDFQSSYLTMASCCSEAISRHRGKWRKRSTRLSLTTKTWRLTAMPSEISSASERSCFQ